MGRQWRRRGGNSDGGARGGGGCGGGWGAISRELRGRVISQFFDMDLQRKKYYLQFSCQTAASTDVVVAILDVVVEILG
jgi:hypothetical protein